MDAELTILDRIMVVLTGAAAAGLCWAVVMVVVEFVDRWRNRLLAETEVELQELLLLADARKIMNISLIAGAVLAGVGFIMGGAAGGRWSTQAGMVTAIPVFVAFVFLPRFVIRFLKLRRRERFDDQLEEALMGMANALKAGFSIQQAIDMVIRRGRQPIAIEFKLMMQQTRLGMSMDDALQNMARRVNSGDFELVASAISTARMTGGDLTGVLARLAELTRERLRIQRRIRSLTAQGRLQGAVLGMMPILLLMVLALIAPNMIAGFFGQPLGWVLTAGVVLLEVGGFLMIRQIVNIDI